MDRFIEELRDRKTLDDNGFRALLESGDATLREQLRAAAQEVADARFGKRVWLRALIEWSNVCRNDCLYCGIRRSNRKVRRYTLSREEILSACERAWRCGLRTFVLQGGENPAGGEILAGIVEEIRASWPEAAITLSVGELPPELYRVLRRSGADRYLLRHESANPAHYARLHPAGMSLQRRLDCLRELRSLGFQVGMGMMVGSPFQTLDDLVADLRLMEAFRPDMIGLGPFIPHPNTPLARELPSFGVPSRLPSPAALPSESPSLTQAPASQPVQSDAPSRSADLTLRLYSILRLMRPEVMMPSTTALSTLLPGGRMAGILAGANVLMPNFTPGRFREQYALYQGKSAADGEEILAAIRAELASVGYADSPTRGDALPQPAGGTLSSDSFPSASWGGGQNH